MQTQTTTVKKVAGFIPDCPEYNVLLNDRIVGKVYRGWWRLGGVAWSHSERPTFHSGFKTRQEAVTDLIKKSESKPLIDVITNEPDWQWTGRGIEYCNVVISTQSIIKLLNQAKLIPSEK